MAGVPFCCFPISMATRFEPQEFRILLLRRLWCPLPLCSASCRCGRPLDPRGHHRAACQVAGVLGRRGFPIESAVARVCREAGGRVTTNVRVQDLDIPPGAAPDNRRLEVVVDGLPLFHGAQLAVDATMVSPVRRDGTARRQCAMTDGAAMTQARRRKERTYPELAQVHGRARLVVVACEVGGRWSREALSFVHSLSKAKARSEPEEFREVVERAWVRRWSSLLACAAARAFACRYSRGDALQGSTVQGQPLPRCIATTVARCSVPLEAGMSVSFF